MIEIDWTTIEHIERIKALASSLDFMGCGHWYGALTPPDRGSKH